MSDEGVDLLALVGVDHHSRPLVHQQKVLVLVDDVKLGLEDREEGVLRGRGVEELVVDVELKHVPLHQPGVPLGPLAVDLYPLDADILLGQGGGEQGQGLAQPAVQPLPGVVGSDGEFLHGRASSLCPSTLPSGGGAVKKTA